MLNNIRYWFIKYDVEISWFMIGWFLSEFFHDVAKGAWGYALFDLAILIINYALRTRR